MRENLKPMWRNCPVWVLRVLLIAMLPLYMVVGAIAGMRELLYSWSNDWYELRSL